MKVGNFWIKIKNESRNESIYYDLIKPNGGGEKEVLKQKDKDDYRTESFSELEFDLYRKKGTGKEPVVITDFAVMDPCNSLIISIDGKKTKVRIGYTKEIKPKSISPGTPPNVEAGVKE